MEIMIAAAILVVGLLGILALFPVAINTGKTAIQDTNAVLIAQSVEQALRDGIANRKGQDSSGKWTYFLFQHDGVLDELPRNVSQADPSKDYYILFPDVDVDGARRAKDRVEVYQSAPLFLYPEDDGMTWTQIVAGVEKEYSGDPDSGSSIPNGGGNPTRADDDSDDHTWTVQIDEDTEDEYVSYRVRRTYQLGAKVQREAEGEERFDPLYQYSFAFTLRRAYHDASLGQQPLERKELIPASELFEAEILVFRSFLPESDALATPIYQTKIYLHK